ncbi:MAG: AmpG family muropeptide MFS transporter, partial [Magnetococcales bacterium]|nr:AmpG family muropeptide MFS transporter [Magnetococcales bacterium]
MRETFAEPFLEMVRRNGSALVAMLGFIVLYKLGDALAGVIANPFYIQMG